MIVYSGSHVKETFKSDFKSLVNGLAIDNEHVKFQLNQQDAKTVNLSCDHAFAYEHITFINVLDSEVREHGIAIVIATDCRNDVHTTIFVVCADD